MRVPVTRLADRAGVEQPALAGEVDLGAFLAQGERQLLGAEAERDVTVPDEHERLLGRLEREERDLGREHVLPDRITWARVVELRALEHH